MTKQNQPYLNHSIITFGPISTSHKLIFMIADTYMQSHLPTRLSLFVSPPELHQTPRPTTEQTQTELQVGLETLRAAERGLGPRGKADRQGKRKLSFHQSSHKVPGCHKATTPLIFSSDPVLGISSRALTCVMGSERICHS